MRRSTLLCLNAFFLMGLTLPSHADVSLPAIFSDHAVLQKSSKVPIWGKASPEEKVTVTLDQVTASTTASAEGKWNLQLDLHAVGQGPFTLVVEGKNKLTLSDILVGEVWLCSGQSNMEFGLGGAIGFTDETALPANPQLRQFRTATVASPVPLEDVAGKWITASPQTVKDFTAVGYFFGKKLQKELNTPVGLVHSSWGGTPVESWISSGSFDTDQELKIAKDKAQKTFQDFQEFTTKFQDWQKKFNREDRPLPTDLTPYVSPSASTEGWKPIKLPGRLSEAGLPECGAVWLRKKITLPPELVNKTFPNTVGDFHDALTFYWNGLKIGQSDLSTKNGQSFWTWSDLNKSPEITVTLRVFNTSGDAIIQPGQMNFSVGNKLPLEGEWLAKMEYELPLPEGECKTAQPPIPPLPAQKQYIASFLYNAKINPLVPYAIAGVIWYQGESNAWRAFQYRTAFPLLITDWRKQWAQGDFPFYFCQLANHMARKPTPEDSAWAELREAQNLTLSLPQTGQAVLIDIGEEKDIHPRNKKDAGERLSFIALAKTYGKQIPYVGPTYDSMTIQEGSIRLKFKNTDGGLVAHALPDTYQPKSLDPATVPLVRNSPSSDVEGFAICGEDKLWKWAQAKIDGNEIVVSSPDVPKPIAVRYAWADNPICNLYNRAGLPAGPFRTDSFTSVTEKNRY